MTMGWRQGTRHDKETWNRHERLHAGFLAGAMLLTLGGSVRTDAAERRRTRRRRKSSPWPASRTDCACTWGCGRPERPCHRRTGREQFPAGPRPGLGRRIRGARPESGRSPRRARPRHDGKVRTNALPYRRDLSSLVVVEDPAALAKQGIGRDEILRVTAPGGILCSREGGKWTKSVKPRPKEMDEWTHPAHGPDGNMVSTDRR